MFQLLENKGVATYMNPRKLIYRNWQLFMSSVNIADGRNDALSRPLMQCINSCVKNTFLMLGCHSLHSLSKCHYNDQMGLCLLFAASIWPKESNEASNLAWPDCFSSHLYVKILRKFII